MSWRASCFQWKACFFSSDSHSSLIKNDKKPQLYFLCCYCLGASMCVCVCLCVCVCVCLCYFSFFFLSSFFFFFLIGPQYLVETGIRLAVHRKFYWFQRLRVVTSLLAQWPSSGAKNSSQSQYTFPSWRSQSPQASKGSCGWLVFKCLWHHIFPVVPPIIWIPQILNDYNFWPQPNFDKTLVP